ncbi:TetR/AcrR family transcriptional regulator, partial [Hydrogenimonas sp.]
MVTNSFLSKAGIVLFKKIHEFDKGNGVKETIRQKVLETKRRILLEEAARIFESEGFTALKIQEIAEKLGMSVGALYNMFGSKEGL